MTRRSILFLIEFFINNKASQNGIRSESIDCHEDGSNNVGEDENDNCWDQGRVKGITIFGPVGNNEVGSKGSRRSNKDFSEQNEDTSDTGNDTHSQRISENKEESVFCGAAEALAGQGNLDVGVLVQEFNESFEASKVALETLEGVYNNLTVFSCHLLGLSLNISKDDSDHLDNSKNQRSKCDRTKVISEESLDTCSDGFGSILASSLREIPQAS